MQYLQPVGLEMDALADNLPRLVEEANGKYFRKQLENQTLTNARNMLIEIMINARNNQFKKSGLLLEIQRGL